MVGGPGGYPFGRLPTRNSRIRPSSNAKPRAARVTYERSMTLHKDYTKQKQDPMAHVGVLSILDP